MHRLIALYTVLTSGQPFIGGNCEIIALRRMVHLSISPRSVDGKSFGKVLIVDAEFI